MWFASLFFNGEYISFVCHEFVVTVREGVNTPQDIFEQRNHPLTEVRPKNSGVDIHLKWPYRGHVPPFEVWFSGQPGLEWSVHFAWLAWKRVCIFKLFNWRRPKAETFHIIKKLKSHWLSFFVNFLYPSPYISGRSGLWILLDPSGWLKPLALWQLGLSRLC